MVGVLHSGAGGLGSGPGRGCCVLFLGGTLCSRSASLRPGVWMGAGGLDAWGWPGDGLAFHPGGGGGAPGCFMLWRLGWAPAWWAAWLICRPFYPTLHISSLLFCLHFGFLLSRCHVTQQSCKSFSSQSIIYLPSYCLVS